MSARLVARVGGDGRTHLAVRDVRAPWRLGRVLHLDARPAGAATVMLQSLTGVLVDRAEAHVEVLVEAGAAVVLVQAGTTCAHAGRSSVVLEVELEPGAHFEHVAPPVLALDGACVATALRVRAAPDARWWASEVWAAHPSATGWEVHAHTSITIGATLLVIERSSTADDATAQSPARLGGARAVGTAWSADGRGVSVVRSLGPEAGSVRAELRAAHRRWRLGCGLPDGPDALARIGADQAQAAATPAANRSTSSLVVSHEHIQRTWSMAASHV